jgi:hypothetical protein
MSSSMAALCMLRMLLLKKPMISVCEMELALLKIELVVFSNWLKVMKKGISKLV